MEFVCIAEDKGRNEAVPLPVLTHLLHRPTGIHSATIYNTSEKNTYILQMSYKFSILKLGEINKDVFKIHVVDMKESIYLH